VRAVALFAALLIGGAPLPVMAADVHDVHLTPGKFTNTDGKSARQLVTVQNNSGQPIFDIIVECGFFHESELLTTGREAALNVQASAVAYLSIAPDDRNGDGTGADRADCRVFAAISGAGDLAKAAAEFLKDLAPPAAHAGIFDQPVFNQPDNSPPRFDSSKLPPFPDKK